MQIEHFIEHCLLVTVTINSSYSYDYQDNIVAIAFWINELKVYCDVLQMKVSLELTHFEFSYTRKSANRTDDYIRAQAVSNITVKDFTEYFYI